MLEFLYDQRLDFYWDIQNEMHSHPERAQFKVEFVLLFELRGDFNGVDISSLNSPHSTYKINKKATNARFNLDKRTQMLS